MTLLDTFHTALLKFSKSLVKLPSLKKETEEIKKKGKKKGRIKNIQSRKECKALQVEMRYLDGASVL